MAVKFNFASTDNYLTRLTDINDTLQALSKLSFTGSENNLPTGAIRLNSNKFQSWSGSAWGDYTFTTLKTNLLEAPVIGTLTPADVAFYANNSLRGKALSAGGWEFYGSISVDTISDKTGNGVLIDGVKLKDGKGTFSASSNIINVIESTGTGYAREYFKRNGSFVGSVGSDTYGNFGINGGDSALNQLTINSAGKVGIGTSTPSEKLHVYEGNFLNSGTFGTSPALSVSGAGTRCLFYPRKAAFRAGYVNGTQWDNDNIGNYSTAMGLNVKSNGTYSTAFGSNTVASGSASIAMGIDSSATGSNSIAFGGYPETATRLTVSGAYSFGIKLGSGSSTLSANNSFRIFNATAIGGNVAWTNYSDRREKEDIRLLTSELDKINLLKPSRFKWKTVNEGVEKTDNLGLIAQEVREVYPEVVKGEEEKEILSLEYTGLIAPMIKAIQELSIKNEELLKTVQELSERISAL